MTTCTFNVPNLDATGDTLYGPRICNQPFIDWAWSAFDFDRGDWDDGLAMSPSATSPPAVAHDERDLVPDLFGTELPE